MTYCARAPKQARQSGVTLVEALVTMVVIAVGLLGLAALQTVSMKSSRAALYRSFATTHAYDIIDCMRANRVGVAAGRYDIAMGASAPSSPTTVADRDVRDWLDALAANLPNGDGAIAVNSGTVTVTVQWQEDRQWDPDPTATPVPLEFVTTSSL